MPSFGTISKRRLATCEPDLIRLMEAVVKETDITVLCGHRGLVEQNKAFREGKSRLKYPHSRHNTMPSMAVDVAPYPIDWEDTDRFEALAEVVKRIAGELGINVRWGGDFEGFRDMPHWELVRR